MYKQSQIYYLTQEKLNDKIYFEKQICLDMKNSYYWSDDWSEEFYTELAIAGFISTSFDTKTGLVLLPELQYNYSILDFENLHISKKVQKLINKDNYVFSINTRFNEVLEQISSQHKYNWLKDEYLQLLKNLYTNKKDNNFQIISIEVISRDSKELIAGEVGYIIGSIYTSLSGFSSKEKEYDNYGTLQLVLLAKFLEKKGFSFWNLGHSYMLYKKKLGCEIYERVDFLKRWNQDKLSPIINPS
ncbi:MAG: Leu/Phe-tRNA-protein transferase [Sulfurimonas sp.]|jgi:Leu/Phe-tRNA-protein transferase